MANPLAIIKITPMAIPSIKEIAEYNLWLRGEKFKDTRVLEKPLQQG